MVDGWVGAGVDRYFLKIWKFLKMIQKGLVARVFLKIRF